MHMSAGDVPRPPVFGGNIRQERGIFFDFFSLIDCVAVFFAFL
jgi:hypothetical protein